MKLTLALLWRTIANFVRTLPARHRARRLNWAFGPCPICRVPFSVEDVWHIPYAARLMDSPTSGRMVCAKLTCQNHARYLNRRKYGRDLFDSWTPGQRA